MSIAAFVLPYSTVPLSAVVPILSRSCLIRSAMSWIPLEANPELFGVFYRLFKYIVKLGVESCWRFWDIYGLDGDSLSVVPKPVIAVLLLFPMSSEVEKIPIGQEVDCSDLFFMKQTVNNSCGAVALLHALVNNKSRLTFTDPSFLCAFIEKLKNLAPSERASEMMKLPKLDEIHENSAMRGQTKAPDPMASTNLHFTCFVQSQSKVYELGKRIFNYFIAFSVFSDGRRNHPVVHSETSSDTFLEDVCCVVKRFMSRDPSSVNFSLVALSRVPQ
ncbi:unnamed protein product [Protopolystoma xenopodis]|uniref:Ubiquitin carboxyl-terminal hydrolase n=1 Tax=Protopolystoma xenopodis TaxID=117903 RepID=A0A448WS07_9PLAT|nr:unnamed protein product [Protopolystoma xenopodis]